MMQKIKHFNVEWGQKRSNLAVECPCWQQSQTEHYFSLDDVHPIFSYPLIFCFWYRFMGGSSDKALPFYRNWACHFVVHVVVNFSCASKLRTHFVEPCFVRFIMIIQPKQHWLAARDQCHQSVCRSWGPSSEGPVEEPFCRVHADFLSRYDGFDVGNT